MPGDIKQLKVLFPQLGDESTIVIIDDQPDVWSNSPNLLHIEPCKAYLYFALNLVVHYFAEPQMVNTLLDASQPPQLVQPSTSDSDNYLLHTANKLDKIHSIFFSEEGSKDVRV